MSPVAGLVLLLASSYVSSLVTPKLDADTSIVSYGTDEELAKPGFIVEKLESCPADVDYPKCNPLIKVKPECSQDKDCKGKRKCCTSGCTQRCLLPLQPKLNPCPCFDDSMCIYVKPAPYECHSDSQCQGTDRCCFSKCRYQCTPTVTVKPGQCPAPKKKIIAMACTQDSDCSGDKKCCEQKGLKCVKPEKEHPGVCPTGLQDLSCSYLNKTLCSRDSDCLPEQKCCLSHDNILQCTAVKNEKPGSCPITRARCLLPFVKPLCNSDRDCLGQQKCCTPLCLRQCTDPVPKVPEKECPAVATLIKCQPPYPPAECDDEDKKCPSGQKCCDVGCRMACVDV